MRNADESKISMATMSMVHAMNTSGSQKLVQEMIEANDKSSFYLEVLEGFKDEI